MKYIFSIIIVAKNEGLFLENTIKSLLSNHLISFEIIVVDDGSTDNGFRFLDEFSSPIQIRLIRGKNLGVAKSRNKGADIAKGQYLIFLDAHVLVGSNFILDIYHTLQKRPISFLGVLCNKFSDKENYYPKKLPLYSNEDISMFMNDWVYVPNKKTIIEVPFIIGACMVIKKSIFVKIGGFYNFIKGWGPEDRSLCLEAYLQGYNLYLNPNISIRHHFKEPTSDRDQWFNLLYNSLACGYVLYDEESFKNLLNHLKNEKDFDLIKHPIYWLFLRDKPMLEKIKNILQKRRVRTYDEFINKFSLVFPYLSKKNNIF